MWIQLHLSHHVSSYTLSALEAGRMDPFLICAVLTQTMMCFSLSKGDVLLTDPKGVFKSEHEWRRRWWHSPTRRKADCVFFCLSIFSSCRQTLNSLNCPHPFFGLVSLIKCHFASIVPSPFMAGVSIAGDMFVSSHCHAQKGWGQGILSEGLVLLETNLYR